MFAYLELGRADQVSHVFDPKQIEAGGIQPVPQQPQAAAHHGGIEVTGTAGGDRHHRNPHGLQPLGVELGRHVTLQHGHGEFLSQQGQAVLQQGGLAGAWAAHHIQAEQLPGIEVLAVVGGLVLVGRQQVETQGVFQGHVHSDQGRRAEAGKGEVVNGGDWPTGPREAVAIPGCGRW